MYDFCFVPFYAGLLALGGLLGLISKGSMVSAASGFGSALLLCGLSYLSFSYGYKKKVHWKPPIFGQLAITSVITVMMYNKWQQSGKMHIALVALCSFLMVLYYLWNLTLFKPGPHGAKNEKAKESIEKQS